MEWLIQVMVPLTSKAFMRGHLVHTNEVVFVEILVEYQT